MILDELLEFADAVAVTGAAATRNVGDIINTQVVRDLGVGRPVYFVVQIDVAPTGADTVKFQLVSDSTTTIAVDGTQTIHFASKDIAIASLPVKTRPVVIALPMEGLAYEQYLAFQVVNVGASDLAALVVSAFLTLDVNQWKAYADAID